MRIGMILDKVFPPDPRVENEAISLIKNGHEVYLFCLKYGKEKDNEKIKGIQVIRYASNKMIYKLSALVYTIPFYSLIMAKKINHFLNTNKIDVVHIHDIQIAEATFRAAKNLKLKTVLDLHENRPEIMKFYVHLQKFPGKFLISSKKWKQKEEIFIKKADKVIVITEESKDEIIKRTNTKSENIIIVPNTVHQTFYKNAVIQNEIIDKYKNNFVLLYLGDTGLRRGLQTAIASLNSLKNKIPTIKLVIIGSNTSDTVLKSQVEDLDIKHLVDFEGWQDEKLFPSYIKASSVCISPLHKNLHHDTTYANKLFQYMSFSKPLLVSNATAQKNIIEKTNCGLVHLEKDSDDFANNVVKLFEDEILRETLGKNGKRFVEEDFYWEKASKDLIDFYSKLST
ncbi:MAG: glycosyltransferase family 4 protein [Lutibacter sp.]|uniref:glycosyltransferase family 4 protein n=1 Tax=Lutibacter sp. TaxID=1925666 RepID=UPI0017EA87FB|nr:glycosyltransferase family 4 protein [Lutibacter sp.]MBT8317521.1 glycosyltransferase family 4 protein [Lutibacter sp.]NNJ58380.1 glycosyltransferase family 4 protein [Lutibacter sp.]